MASDFQRMKKQGSGILLLMLFLGFAIGLPFGYYMGAAVPTDDRLTMVYSSEKKGWIEDMVGEFKAWYYQRTNRTISVNFRSMGSREMVIALQTGEINPILWSPASDLEVASLNSLYPTVLNLSDVVSIIHSPTVIGTWNNTPYTNMTGFEDLREYAILPYDLRFAHTDPRLSNSGYTSMMMQLAAYFNYTTGTYYNASLLTVDNLTDEYQIDDDLASWLADIEKEADYYGKSTGYLAEKAKTDYQVFYVYENIIIDLNNDPTLDKQAITIYPEEGVFLNNHPFCVLDGDWVSSHEKDVARLYLEFMSLNSSVAKAFTRGFRPIDTSILGNSTYNETFNQYFCPEYGVAYDPPMRVHGVPQDPLVLDYVTDVWLQVRAD